MTSNKKPIVMVIEDEKVLSSAIARKLNMNNFKIILFDSGRKALKYFSGKYIKPDIIWLDYYLKDNINGLEFLQIIKKDNKLKKIPVIVVSNSANPNNVKAMLALGAKEYYLKAEQKLEDIIDNITKMLDDRKTR